MAKEHIITNRQEADRAFADFAKAMEKEIQKVEAAAQSVMQFDVKEVLINPSDGSITLFTPKSVGQWRPDLPGYTGGALRDSLKTQIKKSKKSIDLHIIAGGDAPNFPEIGLVDYAHRVHEEMQESANWTTKGTGPKFLNKGFDAAIPDIRKLMIDELKRKMKLAQQEQGE